VLISKKKKKTLHFLTTANLFAAKMVGSLRTTAIKTYASLRIQLQITPFPIQTKMDATKRV
jgi:hypothetical protein